MAEKVRIGFVGVGAMGQSAHLRNYVTVPDCEVVAIAELRPKLRESVALKYSIGKTYETAAQMLESEKLDGVVASQPFTHHGSIVPPLYAAGVPIFTEKPIAASVATGEKIPRRACGQQVLAHGWISQAQRSRNNVRKSRDRSTET